MPKTMMAGAAVTAVIAMFVIALLRSPPQPAEPLQLLSGTVLSPRDPIASFTLVDQRGSPFTQDSFAGRWSLVFAGFTQCPDICPTTLATLAQVHDRLNVDAKKLQIILLSVDPERDTSEVLAEYLDFFNPEFVGVTGEPAQLDVLYSALGIQRIRIPGARGEYSVDHSAALLLVSPDGRLAAYFLPPVSARRLAADLATLLT